MKVHIRTRTPSYARKYAESGILFGDEPNRLYTLPAGGYYPKFMVILNKAESVRWIKLTEFIVELGAVDAASLKALCPGHTHMTAADISKRMERIDPSWWI